MRIPLCCRDPRTQKRFRNCCCPSVRVGDGLETGKVHKLTCIWGRYASLVFQRRPCCGVNPLFVHTSIFHPLHSTLSRITRIGDGLGNKKCTGSGAFDAGFAQTQHLVAELSPDLSIFNIPSREGWAPPPRHTHRYRGAYPHQRQPSTTSSKA